MLCKKSVFTSRQYAHVEKGEDTDIIEFLNDQDHLVQIDDQPGLYIYVYHGGNTWNIEHFSLIFRASRELTEHAVLIGEILKNKYTPEKSAILLTKILL